MFCQGEGHTVLVYTVHITTTAKLFGDFQNKADVRIAVGLGSIGTDPDQIRIRVVNNRPERTYV